jgi:hypothetical protein
VKYSAVTIKLGHLRVASSDWFTVFEGILTHWPSPGPRQYQLGLTCNDLLLRGKFPRRTVMRSDWPNAHTDAIGKAVPIIYGELSSVLQDDNGMCPLLYVNTSGFVYLVCAGAAKEVTAVYAAGEKVNSGWTYSYPTIGGRIYTVVTFDSDQGDNEITADVKGLETAGDGSGTLIENPIEIIAHLISNFLYGDYKSGAPLATNSVIDSGLLATATAFASNKGYSDAVRIGDRAVAKTVISDLALSSQAHVFWTNAGKIGIGYDSHLTTSIYQDDPWWRGDKHDIGGMFAVDHQVDSMATTVEMKFSTGDGSGTRQSITVSDPDLDDTVTDTLTAILSPSTVL